MIHQQLTFFSLFFSMLGPTFALAMSCWFHQRTASRRMGPVVAGLNGVPKRGAQLIQAIGFDKHPQTAHLEFARSGSGMAAG
jgi:hypothetical protein